MGKVVKFTGSRLLGAELRRLRGGRSLKQISELSKTPPLSDRIAPVAAPTLSQVENGISFPSLETLHALSHVYRCPVQQLLDLVVQERLADSDAVFSTEDDALDAYRQEYEASSWSPALAASFQGERLAAEQDRPVWRMRRALVLQEMGMEQDSLDLLMDALEDPELPAERNVEGRILVANALGRLGRIQSAAALLDSVEPQASSELEPALQRRLVRSRAYLTLQRAINAPKADVASLRRCLRELETEVANCDSESIASHMRLHAAACRWLGGNRLVARRDLETELKTARAGHDEGVELAGLTLLGMLERRAGRHRVALLRLEEASSLASQLGEPTTAFEATFEAYLASKEIEPRRVGQLLKRCERFHPFVRARSVNALLFERLSQEA